MKIYPGATGARLPRWLLPDNWPMQGHQPQLATLHFHPDGLQFAPCEGACADYLPLNGALVLPALIEPHAHLDKTFTFERSPARQPGLLAAISAMHQDRVHWSREDLQQRAEQALRWAVGSGVGVLRTHVDWFSPEAPLAWQVIGELQHPLCRIERVALAPLSFFARQDDAQHIAAQVAVSGPGALLGGFIHSSNWDAVAFANLLHAAEQWQLDIDLHIDEELNADAQGMRWLANYLQQHPFSGQITCSHSCALSQQEDALQILDRLALHRVTLIALPLTNLLLQDAVPDRTPRQRGLTLVKEAQARGLSLLLGADNVQDAFCPLGSYDPLDTLFSGVLSLQLGSAFDEASQLICQPDALYHNDVVIFPSADAASWPLRQRQRYRLKQGVRYGDETDDA
ncbi:MULTISPECIES: amidohydrolase family protein [Pantoea]|uniref:amidohydrolase family protein n=1 Tax=Pantoea TaxID=53335 RepID=UPI0014192000|nr:MULTISPECIES: amidohydrolase family protein [Pantoea]MCI1030481.1 cytosine deaminase [Pantoea dispersa]MDI9768899.1 cytosine deaminase [Pantoea dispersa]MDR6298041.1 cytosine deaminase [Pantoea dispersa]NIE53106.1 cytosine deaminase [Pantoea sp. Ap-870]